MIRIYIPDKFIPEREYVINFFFDNQLGLQYEIKKHDLPFYRILLPNQHELHVKDHFFSKYDEADGYLYQKNIPNGIIFFQHDTFAKEGIPFFFGETSLNRDNDDVLKLGADIFASAFFMLTRWEEYVTDLKDEHGRFPGSSSLAYKFNFLHRPVVNEYTEMIWKMMRYLGYNGERRKREFRIVPTHDIDHFLFWDKKKRKNFLKNVAGDIFQRHDFKLAGRRISSYLKLLTGNIDPSITYQYLMDKAESIGSKALFYFIAGGETVFDASYSIQTTQVRAELDNIKIRGHIIGIHPSYNSFTNIDQISKETTDLDEVTGLQVKESRNHYLRFDVPTTWEILKNAGIKTDSTMYYSDLPGFRCGICNEFPVFDFIQREQLELIERPLIVMDSSFKNQVPEITFSEINKLKQTVKTFKGDFVFLWHNSNIDTPGWKIYKNIFEEAFYGE